VVKFFSEIYSSINQWEKEIDISKVLEKNNTNPAVQFPKTLAAGFLYRKEDPLLFQKCASRITYFSLILVNLVALPRIITGAGLGRSSATCVAIVSSSSGRI
jgi:hypothetical protein